MTTDPEAPSTRGRSPLTDVVVGGVLLLVGVGVLLATAQLRGGGPTDPLGPRGFPGLLGVGFLLVGIAVIVSSVRNARRAGAGEVARDAGDEDDDGPALKLRLALASAAVVLYVVVLPVAGFLLTTAAFVAGVIWLQGGARTRPFVAMVIGFPAAVYVLFSVLLGVPLPPGVFDPVLLLGGR